MPSNTLSFSQLEAYWTQAADDLGHPELAAQAPTMAQVAELESSGNPDASITEPNGAGSYQTSNGLWQISTGTLVQPTNWSDPLTNAEDAVQKYLGQTPQVAWPHTYPKALAALGLSSTSGTTVGTGTAASTPSSSTSAGSTNPSGPPPLWWYLQHPQYMFNPGGAQQAYNGGAAYGASPQDGGMSLTQVEAWATGLAQNAALLAFFLALLAGGFAILASAAQDNPTVQTAEKAAVVAA